MKRREQWFNKWLNSLTCAKHSTCTNFHTNRIIKSNIAKYTVFTDIFITVPRFSYTNLNQFKFPDFRHFKQLLTLYDYKFCKQPTDKTEQQDYDKSTFKLMHLCST